MKLVVRNQDTRITVIKLKKNFQFGKISNYQNPYFPEIENNIESKDQ